jgi:hypothetical protein
MKKIIMSLLAILLVAHFAEARKMPPKVKNTTGITSIEFHRTMCYGKCPDYRLVLSYDGSATYIGRKFAPYKGTYIKKLSATKVQAVFKEFERYKVDTCQETYQTIPDMAGLEYQIVYTNGEEKNIKQANSPFAPKFLRALSEKMDKVAKIDKTWRMTESLKEPVVKR